MQPRDRLKKSCRFMRPRMTATLVALSFLAFASPAAFADYEDKSGPSAAASSDPQINNCQNNGADLTGNFSKDPCKLTSTNKTLTDDDGNVFSQTDSQGNQKKYYGGEQVMNFLEDWWRHEFLPSLRGMTAQMTGSRLDQARQLGSMTDANDVNAAALTQQQQEVALKRNLEPSELACVSNTATRAQTKAHASAAGIARAYKMDMTRRSANAPGSTAELGPSADIKARWDIYCEVFDDPDNNDGITGCPVLPDDDVSRVGAIPNGDIAIETLLFQDTLDIVDAKNADAALALLQNLVQPNVPEKIPHTALKSAAGREAALKRQHLDAVRNVASHTISSIIARRSAIPLDPLSQQDAQPATTDPETGTPVVTEFKGASMINSSSADACAGKEGNEYSKCFAENETNRLAASTSESPKWPGAYSSPTSTLCQRLSRNASRGFSTGSSAFAAWELLKRKGLVVEGQPPQNPGDLVYWGYTPQKISSKGGKTYGHTGVYAGGNQAYSVVRSKNPEIIKHPMSRFNNSNSYVYLGYVPVPNDGPIEQIDPSSGSSTGIPVPPKDPAELVAEIRTKAGVDPAAISPTPSYNEIMLAMTKERFMDPEYFIRIQGSLGEIKQEQTSINAFITQQYQDIYEMQEQINMLLAVRAALKLDQAPRESQTSSAPIK